MASFWAKMTSTRPCVFSHAVSSSSALSRSQSATIVPTMVMCGRSAMTSRKPMLLSRTGGEPDRPRISTIFPPFGPSSSVTYWPACLPIRRLSGPMNSV